LLVISRNLERNPKEKEKGKEKNLHPELDRPF